jgi:hypothetical protein
MALCEGKGGPVTDKQGNLIHRMAGWYGIGRKGERSRSL